MKEKAPMESLRVLVAGDEEEVASHTSGSVFGDFCEFIGSSSPSIQCDYYSHSLAT